MTARDRGAEHRTSYIVDTSNTGDNNRLSNHANHLQLKRQLSLLHGVGITCGLIVGNAIFISPKGVAAATNSPGLCLCLWLLCGVLSTLGALSFAELGLTFPGSGANYFFLNKMFGELPAFIYMWSYVILLRPGYNAIKCLAFVKYILEPLFAGCDKNEYAVILLGTLLCWIMVFLNCVNVKASASLQTVLAGLSQLALLVISALGLVHLITVSSENLDQGFKGSSTNGGNLVLGAYAGLYTFNGWTALTFLTEEVENPKRNLPLAICISMGIVTLLYLLTNVAYISVLGVDGLLLSDAVAVSFANRTMGMMAWIVPLFVSVSTASSFNSGTLIGSRLIFVAARQGHLPDVVSLISVHYLSPITSLILMGILTTLYLGFFEMYFLLHNTVLMDTLFTGLTVSGMIYFRRIYPELPRPIKFPLVIPVIYFCCICFLCVVSIVTKPSETATGLAFGFLTAIPAFILCKWKNKPKALTRYTANFTRLTQKLVCGSPQEGNTVF